MWLSAGTRGLGSGKHYSSFLTFIAMFTWNFAAKEIDLIGIILSYKTAIPLAYYYLPKKSWTERFIEICFCTSA